MATRIINGITLGYEEAGDGQNAVVLVHGHPFDRSMWRGQVGAIARAGWRVVAPDLRGYGESTVVPGKTTLDVFADDVAALLDSLGIASVVMTGLSMGGQIAMEFCRRHPARILGVVLAATSPWAETAEGRRSRNAMADRLLAEGMGPYAEEALPRMLASGTMATMPDVVERVLEMMRSAPPAGAAAALRGRAERPGYERTLARLDVPALVVAGDADPFTSRDDVERMRALLTGSELVWMHGVGHMPNLERPAAFDAALLRFLHAVEAAQRPA